MASTRYFINDQYSSHKEIQNFLRYAQVGDSVALEDSAMLEDAVISENSVKFRHSSATIIGREVSLSEGSNECRLFLDDKRHFGQMIVESMGPPPTLLCIDNQRFESPFDYPHVLMLKVGDTFRLDGACRKVIHRHLILNNNERALFMKTTTP